MLGWLTKIALTLAVLGFLSYDGIAIVTANISASDRANTLASEAADDVRSMRDINKAYGVISTEAAENGDTIEPQDFKVATDGHVTLVLRREAGSLWMTRIAPLRRFLHVHATGEGSPGS